MRTIWAILLSIVLISVLLKKNKMKTLFQIIGLIIAFVHFPSCTIVDKQHYYYMQNPPQVTAFKEKNELRLSGNVAGAEENNGSTVQAAYSITNHVGITANWFKYQAISGNGGNWKAQYYDLGIGYFKDFQKKGLFEIYGGFGLLEQRHEYYYIKTDSVYSWWFGPTVNQTLIPAGSATYRAHKIFVQPSYGYSFDAIDIIISAKLSYLNFTSVDNNVTPGNYRYNEVQLFSYGKSYLFIEPAITFRAGWKYVKFQLQYAYNGYPGINCSPFTLSTGIQLSFAKRYLKKKNPAESTSSELTQ